MQFIELPDMRKIKVGKLQVPRVKWTETVFCTHCFDTGKDRKTAECVKNNLPRQNRRWHPDLESIRDQAWMLVWPGNNNNLSSSPFNLSSLTNYIRASPRPSAASLLIFPMATFALLPPPLALQSQVPNST